MPPASRRWTLVVLALVFAVVAMPAQQMVTETRDPAQAQDEDFATVGQGVDDAALLQQPARRSSAEGRQACRRRRTCSAITSAPPPS